MSLPDCHVLKRTTILLLILGVADSSHAQRSSVRGGKAATSQPARPVRETRVIVEIIAGTQGVGIKAQEWRLAFERLKVEVRIHRGLPGDMPEIRERMLGRLRQVTVVGRMDRSGKLYFADRVYTLSDTRKMAEWFRELKTYGAQGTPEGQPIWGLSKEKFGELYSGLSQELTQDVVGLSLASALEQFQLPRQFPIRLSTQTQSLVGEPGTEQASVRQRLRGFSKGTALAVMLNDFGLGYRPLRTPEGEIELVIDPWLVTDDFWPVGWEPKIPRPKMVPRLFKITQVELEDVPLVDVLSAVSTRAEVPVLIDHFRIEEARIDLQKLRVSYRPRKASLSQLLRTATVPNRLKRKLMIDERGRPFLWITTLEASLRKR